ncbi:hypothetical protein, partial [Nostoc sp.]|uniref:hypothetical protein n=1 Tax=Nostoc sp. TaxID=1180 RepID=UPI003B5E9FA4
KQWLLLSIILPKMIPSVGSTTVVYLHENCCNPSERLWQLLKKLLKNELFSSLQNLRVGVARRRHRIQQLFELLTFEQVMSVSSYNFILEALFYAASY